MNPIITLNSSQQAILNGYITGGQYAQGYLYVQSIINAATPTASGSTLQNLNILSNWLGNSAPINANDGSYKSEFVRGYTYYYGFLINKPVTPTQFQIVSNKLAVGVLQLFSANLVTSAQQILDKDVGSAVGKDGFNFPSTNGWAGTLGDILPPQLLGLGQDFVQLNCTNSIINCLANLSSNMVAAPYAAARSLADSVVKTYGNLFGNSSANGTSSTGTLSNLKTLPTPNGGVKVVIEVEKSDGTKVVDTIESTPYTSGPLAGNTVITTTDNSTGLPSYQIIDSVTKQPIASGSSFTLASSGNGNFSTTSGSSQFIYFNGKVVGQVDNDGSGIIYDTSGGGNDQYFSAGQLSYNGANGVLTATVGGASTPHFGTSSTVGIQTNTGATTGTGTSSATSGVNDAGNTLISTGSATVSGTGNVNTDTGNTATSNYFITDGTRPGNHNIISVGNPVNLGNGWVASSGAGMQYVGQPATTSGGAAQQGAVVNTGSSQQNQITPVDPLILDLDGAGVTLTSYAAAPVSFDIDNDRTASVITPTATGQLKQTFGTDGTHSGTVTTASNQWGGNTVTTQDASGTVETITVGYSNASGSGYSTYEGQNVSGSGLIKQVTVTGSGANPLGTWLAAQDALDAANDVAWRAAA